jgi:hypothetical protein
LIVLNSDRQIDMDKVKREEKNKKMKRKRE